MAGCIVDGDRRVILHLFEIGEREANAEIKSLENRIAEEGNRRVLMGLNQQEVFVENAQGGRRPLTFEDVDLGRIAYLKNYLSTIRMMRGVVDDLDICEGT